MGFEHFSWCENNFFFHNKFLIFLKLQYFNRAVPDSPYAQPPGGYYQGPGASSQFPPSGYQYPGRPHKAAGHPGEDADRDRYAGPPPYYPPYGYGYDRGGYEGEGYVKRQRNNEDAVKSEPGREEESGRYPPGPNRPPYYDHRGPPPPGGG